MSYLSKFSSFWLLLFSLCLEIDAVHDSMNFFLSPRQRQCFYEDFDKITPARTIEAFVQSGGNLDVQLVIHGPLELDEIRNENFKRVVLAEKIDATRQYESDTGTFQLQFKPSLQGTYAICLDNSHSYFSSKLVQLDIRTAPRLSPIILHTGGEIELSGDEDEAAVARAQESLGRLSKGMHKIMVMQQRDRHRLSLHSQTNNISHFHIVSGSIFETIIFIAVAIFQIFFVRRWFLVRHSLGSKQKA